MEANFYSEDKLLVLKITDEIDDHNVQNIRRKADYEMERYMPKRVIFDFDRVTFRKADYEMERYMPKRVIFDFDRVTFMDSAGIGLIIGRYKLANMIGAKLEITNLTKSIRRIFDMSGILKLIPTVESPF